MGFADELREAVEKLDGASEPGEPVELTCEEMGLFLDENPIVLAIADELGSFTEALVFLDEATEIIGDFPTPQQAIRLFEKTHSPFKRKKSLTLDAHVYAPANPRSNVKDWDCDSAGKYKQTCKNTKTGATRTVDMTGYYPGKKAVYMANWRKKTAAAGK